MKKVFIFNGSSNLHSTTEKVIDDFLLKLKRRFGTINYSKYKMSEKYKFCHGCASCFRGQKCPLDDQDELGMIKNKMLDSDIIVFATPTYFKCVSAQMKLFLDRITYLTHLFSCVGKTGVIIVTGSYNGVDETVQYLKDFMIRLGLVNLKIIDYKMVSDTQGEIMDKVNIICNEIYEYYTGKREIDISKESEYIFTNTQLYFRAISDCFEKKYWKDNGLLDAKSLEKYINSSL